MKNHLALLLTLQLLCLSSFAQTSSATWTLVCFNKTRAYFYKGELTDWKQVAVFNLLDSFQVKRITGQEKKDNPTDRIILILKGSSDGGQEGMVHLFETASWISKEWKVQPLTAKEKELFELKELDSKPEAMKLNITGTTSNKEALYIRIKNDSTIWYKTDSSYNEDHYTKVNKQDRTDFSAFLDAYQQKCVAKKVPEAIYIAGSSRAATTDFSFVINELEKHKIYKYNLITAPD